MADNKALGLTPQERADAIEEIKKLHSQTAFLAELLQMDKCNADEAKCHMDLIRHAHDSLAGLLKTDALSTALDQAHATCREYSARIHELEGQLGSGTTAAAAMARLKQCEDWFSTWYQMLGWHWMKTDWGPYGLQFETSEEIEHPPVLPENTTFGDKTLAVAIDGTVPYEFLNYDLKKDTFHDFILDTQANHERILDLFKRTFPGARVHKFMSYSDSGGMLLRAEGSVPWEDIEKWHAAILEAGEKLNAGRTGKFYIEKLELASRLASRTYVSHADKKQVAEDRSRLAWLRAVTELWEQAMTQLKDRKSAKSHGLFVSTSALGKELKIEHAFPAGTKKPDVGTWFASQFMLDWERDLDGGKA